MVNSIIKKFIRLHICNSGYKKVDIFLKDHDLLVYMLQRSDFDMGKPKDHPLITYDYEDVFLGMFLMMSISVDWDNILGFNDIRSVNKKELLKCFKNAASKVHQYPHHDKNKISKKDFVHFLGEIGISVDPHYNRGTFYTMKKYTEQNIFYYHLWQEVKDREDLYQY